jgi:hypothetical protein
MATVLPSPDLTLTLKPPGWTRGRSRGSAHTMSEPL